MTPKAPTLIIIFVAVFATLCTSLARSQTDDYHDGPGKCVSFSQYSAAASLSGFHRPVCESFLKQSGVTHFWVPEKFLPNKTQDSPVATPREECYEEMAWAYDSSLAAPLASIFETNRPSPVCQNAFLTTLCYASFPLCEESTTNPGEYVKATKKLCPWLCTMFRDEAYHINNTRTDGDFCTVEDFDFFDYNYLPPALMFEYSRDFQCDSNPIFAPENTPASECIAPSFVRPDPVASRCEQYTGSFCAGIFTAGSRIYVPPGVIQSQMEAAIAENAFTFNATPQESGCPEAALALLCQTTFQECLDFGIQARQADMLTGLEDLTSFFPARPTKMAFGLKPPLEACTSFVDKCSSTPFYAQISGLDGKPLMDCETVAIFNPSQCWISPQQRSASTTPQNTYNFNSKSYFGKYEYEKSYLTIGTLIGPVVYYGSTFAASETYPELSSIPYIDCPAPTVTSPETASRNIYNGRCALPCPSAAYSDAERKQIATAAWVFSIFALIFSGILSLHFLIFKSQRHKRILFWYTLSYFMVVLMIFLGLVVTKNGSLWEKQCAFQTRYEHMEGFSAFQGTLLVFFMLSSMSWWCCIAVDIFQRLILGLQFRKGSSPDTARNIAMHCFCWGMPLICVIALLVGGQIGYDSYLPFAFITVDLSMTSQPIVPLHYIFFFIPVLALAVISYCLIGIILIYFLKYDPSGGLKKFQSSIDRSKSIWFKITQSLKLFGFAFLMVLFIALLIVHEITIANHEAEWASALRRWGEQLLSQGYTGQEPVLTDRMPPSLIIATIFGFCSPGFFMFILYFICSRDVYGLWGGLLYYKLGLTCCKQIAREDTSTGSHGSSDNSSTGTKKGGSTTPADLLSGDGDALTRRPESKPTIETAKPESTAESHPTVLTAPLPQIDRSAATMQSNRSLIPPSKRHEKHERQEFERKATLFKGFKSNKVPLAPSHTSGSDIRDTDSVELALLPHSSSNLQSTTNQSAPVMTISEASNNDRWDHQHSSTHQAPQSDVDLLQGRRQSEPGQN